jgi:hypothetical protein
MRRIGIASLLMIAFAWVAWPVTAGAQPFALTGDWHGRYYYNNNRDSVEFTLKLDADGGRCIGRTQEPNTFGDKSATHLFGNVSCVSAGVQPGRIFRFHKQYDGTGGVSHAVEYSGVVAEDGNTITGQWQIGSGTGQFSMTRDQPR